MFIKKALAFCVLTLLITTSYALEDLLEQYVKHVGLVNSVNYETERQQSKHQRNDKGHSDSIFNFGANRKLNFANVRDKRELNEDDLSQWTHWEYLDDEKNILLRWQTRHQEILFRVEARTLGYVGIGFSPNGGMEGADITMGWVDDAGKAFFLMDVDWWIDNVFGKNLLLWSHRIGSHISTQKASWKNM
ncbi:hypothetical protein AMK59_1598 [Oryctes borbonicus]|uniref:DOMON domain-containing protein n=1 Tax=Oryctes borbonicus TaxID=1629725 RepID=A0A0T6BEZ2_9SCAR|nr:hypothetical protein AMK59_1598 [Oryctes borbonicus]